MNKSKQAWEVEQRSKNPAVTQQELDTQWKSKNPGWAQSLSGTLNQPQDVPVSDKEKGLRAFQNSGNQYTPPETEQPKAPTLADIVTAPTEPETPDTGKPLFNPENFAKPQESTSEVTTLASTIAAPAATVDVPVSQTAAEKNLIRAERALTSLKSESVPEGFTNDMRSKLQEAYDKKVSRNDWAALATTLANAVAQYGAASAAGAKSDGTIKFAPGVDYEARSDRAMREYGAGISEQDKLVAAKQRAVDERNATALRNATSQERMARDTRMMELAGAGASGKMTDREHLEEKRKDTAAANQTKQTIAGNALIETLDEIDNTTDDKTKRSLILKATALQGAAGVTREEMDQATAAGTTPGWLYGTNLDKEKKLNKLAEILASKRGGPSTSPAPSTGKTPVTKSDLTAYATQYNISEEAAKQYLQSQGLQVEGN